MLTAGGATARTPAAILDPWPVAARGRRLVDRRAAPTATAIATMATATMPVSTVAAPKCTPRSGSSCPARPTGNQGESPTATATVTAEPIAAATVMGRAIPSRSSRRTKPIARRVGAESPMAKTTRVIA